MLEKKTADTGQSESISTIRPPVTEQGIEPSVLVLPQIVKEKDDKDWTTEDAAKEKVQVPVLQREPAYFSDPAFFRMVILFAGWVLVLSVLGMLFLAANDKEIPQGVVAVASGLVGLLTGIFAAKSGNT